MQNALFTAYQILVGQLGGVEQVIGGIVVAIIALAIWAIGWNRRQRAANKPGMASLPIIALCFAIALIAMGGATYGLGLRAAATSAPAQMEAPLTITGPKYVGDVYFTVQPGNGGGASVAFRPNDYLDRLRIYVEYSNANSTSPIWPSVWQPAAPRMLLADLRDLTKGEQKVIPLIYEHHDAGQKPSYWWGSAKKDENVGWLGLRGRAQIYFVGPDNKEQKVKFIAIKGTHDMVGSPIDGSPTLMILDENAIKATLNWPE
jgi:hypothetical protein